MGDDKSHEYTTTIDPSTDGSQRRARNRLIITLKELKMVNSH
ncbi:10667_t:CDS:2 [Paraglomus brasilianum]|uniref:10667_t:CDS:1 n=1 Tax=Paraglomus brasilianum TaxID=144538 RepID=A0A9N9FPV3_9GLOM|nr:10667_t:CDS:2 [Paraglomus brasilianum]